MEAERKGRRAIQLGVAERTHGGGRLLTVAPQEIERFGFLDSRVLACVLGIQLRDDSPSDVGDRLAPRNRSREIYLDRVDTGHVMHDHADRPAVSGNRSTPLRIGQLLSKSG